MGDVAGDGGGGGYLGDSASRFSYRTHAEFYPLYCGLDYDPEKIEHGTTRTRFIEILTEAPPHHQAKIIRGILQVCPLGQYGAPDSRTEELEAQLRAAADRVEGAAVVSQPALSITSDFVERAIQDAEALIRSTEVNGAVDRMHAALHGYLLRLCHVERIQHEEDAPIARLLKLLRQRHPALYACGARAEDMTKCLRALASVVDALQPVRNRASMAHPTDQLLDPPEVSVSTIVEGQPVEEIEGSLREPARDVSRFRFRPCLRGAGKRETEADVYSAAA